MVDHPRRERVWSLPITTENPMQKNSSRTLLIRGAIALAATVAGLTSAQAVTTSTVVWCDAVRGDADGCDGWSGGWSGATPDNPILPVAVVDGGFQFSFMPLPGMNFIDPVVAVGYDYALSDLGSPAFQSVELPSVGDDLFTLSLWNGSQWMVNGTLQSGSANAHDFGVGGVREFRITGIEVSAALDPSDPTAFVTGLSFAGADMVNMSQTPITAAVPEPASYALLMFGLAAFGLGMRRRS